MAWSLALQAVVDVYSRDRDGTLTGMMSGGALGAGFGLGLAQWLESLDDETGVGHGITLSFARRF